jgi:preprotein translocase SecE subunit
MKKILNYIKAVIKEAQKIEWLSKKQLINYTTVVILFLVLATALIALMDINLVKLRTFFLKTGNENTTQEEGVDISDLVDTEIQSEDTSEQTEQTEEEETKEEVQTENN